MVPTLMPHFGQVYIATVILLSRERFAGSTTGWMYAAGPCG